ncbi:hypothetical protein [Moorena sp. SIOASIH]|nr:hypothetical protein [Moorena sp. SIOASIH]
MFNTPPVKGFILNWGLLLFGLIYLVEGDGIALRGRQEAKVY